MTIPEIKSRLPILQVLNHYSYKPTAKGGLQCPFHEPTKGKTTKKTLQIYTDTNRYQCFHKDCTAGNGDVIDFIEHQEKCTKHQAIEKAKEILGYQADKEAHSDIIGDDHTGGSVNQNNTSSAGLSDSFKVISTEQMHYVDMILDVTVLGGLKLEGLDRMRVTLKVLSVAKVELPAVRHTVDLYNDDQLQKLIRKLAERLEIGTSKLGASLSKLIDHLEHYRLIEVAEQETKPTQRTQTTAERKQAIDFLQQSNLMANTNDLLGKSGIVGEQINRQILWLVYSSRKRSNPLHVICLGASGTGKTYLQEMVSRFIPEHEKFTFTASTENAFYYLEPYDLCHKVVLIEDMDGVQYLLYPLRELQTKQWISKVVPIKDAQGMMKTRKLDVYGPICLSGTTTKERLYEDNANRCILVHLNNSVEQQESIMAYQRKASAGKIDHDLESQATDLLQQVQQVLEPVKVINPYAESLKIPSKSFKPLRTNQHYLQFIETVTWYHQYQRTEQVDESTGEIYIETTLEDIAIANELMKEVLLTKSDELPKAIRDFFEQLKEWLKAEDPATAGREASFYSKQLRSYFRLYPMKANRYIKTLEQYGYLKKSGGNKKQGYEYEVSDWQEYDELKSNVTILDKLLEMLKTTKKNPKS